jgi:hypothetical protein
MNIAGEWAAIDPPRAIAWARGLTDPTERGWAFANIVESWADTAPQAAGEFALTLAPELRDRAALAVVARWATLDPEKAGEWALRLPDPSLRVRGAAAVLNLWAAVAPDAAGRWVRGIEPDGLREAAITSYLEAVNDWDPEAGLRLAMETSDAALRLHRAEPCFRRWIDLNPTAARQWLARAKLSDETKQRWLAATPAP